MFRLAVFIWLGLIGYKCYEVYNAPPPRSASSNHVQENSLQKPSFNPEWKGSTLQKIKAPRNTKAQMTAAGQNKSSGS